MRLEYVDSEIQNCDLPQMNLQNCTLPFLIIEFCSFEFYGVLGGLISKSSSRDKGFISDLVEIFREFYRGSDKNVGVVVLRNENVGSFPEGDD